MNILQIGHPLRTKVPAGVLLASVMVLAGCTVLKPVPDTTRFYTLAAPAAAPTPAGALRIGVRVTVLADYLRHAPIAVRVSANELRFPHEHRWAERVDEALERAVAGALQPRLPHFAPAPVSSGTAAGAPVLIDVAITACEGNADGSALLAGYWKVVAGDGAAPVATGNFQRTRSGWDGSDFGQLAAMLGALVDELAAEIAPSVPKP